jgi:hypothetical protein
MAALIALMAICLFAAGVVVGIIGMVAVAIRREERNLTLTSAAPGQVASAGRWLNGLYVRVPPPRHRRPEQGAGLARAADRPRTRRTGLLPAYQSGVAGHHGLHLHEEAR